MRLSSPFACTPRHQWMYEEYLRLIDVHTALRLQLYHNLNVACTTMWAVRRSITAESLWRV